MYWASRTNLLGSSPLKAVQVRQRMQGYSESLNDYTNDMQMTVLVILQERL